MIHAMKRPLLALAALALAAAAAIAQDDISRLHVAAVKKARPAVVGITADARHRGVTYYGTGTLLSEDGYVLTSITVVPKDCRDVKVMLEGGKMRDATIVGTVDETELSLLKIEGSGYPFLPLGDSSALKLGETVYSFGNAFHSVEIDDAATLCMGTISGFYELKEPKSESEYKGPVIESTAALNPGADGGPLVDAKGNFIGLLCLNYSPARWLGTSIPVNALKADLHKMMKRDGEPPKQKAIPDGDPSIWPKAVAAADAVVAIEVDRKKDIKPPPRMETPFPFGNADEAAEFRTRPKAPVTGLIVEADGWILTSYYNVAGEINGVTVHLPGGKSVAGEVAGWDETNDIALIKVEATKLPTPTWAPDHSYATGDVVFCLGRSPDPKRLTLTQGVISATGRMRGAAVQLDAKLNYGSTGGPVVNRKGEVIGLAGQITAGGDWGQSSGIGFATIWPKIRGVLDDLKHGKKLKDPPTPFLGVQMDLNADEEGAVIQSVVENSAAATAGIEGGDVIVEINGVKIANPGDLSREIKKYNVGDEIKVKVRRDGKTLDLSAMLRENPEGSR